MLPSFFLSMKRFELFFVALQLPLDFVMLLLAGISAYALRFSPLVTGIRPVIFSLTLGEYITIIFPVILFWMLLFALSGLYSTDPNRRLAWDWYRIFVATAAGLSGVALYLLFRQSIFDSRFLVMASWAFAIIYVSFGRLLIRLIKIGCYAFGVGQRRVALIGDTPISVMLRQAFTNERSLGYNVVGVFSTFDTHVAAKCDALNLDELIVTNPRHEAATLSALSYANRRHLVLKYSPDVFGTYTTRIAVHPLAGVPMVEIKRTPLDGWARIVKRGTDIIVSIMMLALFSPVMLIIALIILIETGRPIIYKNERIGGRGQRFFTLKFRSMYQKDSTGPQFGKNGEAALAREAALIRENNTKQGPIYKIANDPRVTPFGRFLRRWSLDELPQFINVLEGSMSVVGPRPHQPREVDQYAEQYPTVFAVNPGITGLAQVSGRSDLTFEEEMKLDIFYIEHWSLWLDGIIFLKTPFVVLKKRRVP